MQARYLFIVGLGRSGSKLVQHVLRLSPDIRVVSSGETQYMGKLFAGGFREKVRKRLSASTSPDVDELVDLCILESPDKDVWTDLKTGKIPRSRLAQDLNAGELSEKGVYEAILQLRASSIADNTFLIDKTPQHLYHLKTIMTWFPEARAIHMIRDPRAVLASAWTKRMKAYPKKTFFSMPMPRSVYSALIVAHIALTWSYAVHLHNRYSTLYSDRYRLFRFEDLVAKPDSSIPKLADFLGISYAPAMSSPPVVGSSFDDEDTPGMNTGALNRWETVLAPWMKSVLIVLCGRAMKKVGYAR